MRERALFAVGAAYSALSIAADAITGGADDATALIWGRWERDAIALRRVHTLAYLLAYACGLGALAAQRAPHRAPHRAMGFAFAGLMLGVALPSGLLLTIADDACGPSLPLRVVTKIAFMETLAGSAAATVLALHHARRDARQHRAFIRVALIFGNIVLAHRALAAVLCRTVLRSASRGAVKAAAAWILLGLSARAGALRRFVFVARATRTPGWEDAASLALLRFPFIAGLALLLEL